MPVPARYEDIDFKPSQAMQDEARRGLNWRREHGRGGTSIGIARARDIVNGKNLSPETVRRMKAYFDRHAVDKLAEGFEPNEAGYPSNGRIAWALWGGDPGYTWAKARVERMNARDKHMSKEYKTFPACLKAVDNTGIVEAIVAVFGNVDYGDDRIMPGAFSKTLQERGLKVRVLDNHNATSTLSVVGKPLEIREVGRDELPSTLLEDYPDATGGLYTRTQYLLDTAEGLGVFRRIKAGAVDEYSFGYDTVKADYETLDVNGQDVEVRNIREIKLWEYSPVVFAMNPATTTTSAKEAIMSRTLTELEKQFEGVDFTGKRFTVTVNIVPDEKAAVPAQDFPLGDRAREWDGDGAEMRCRAWAGGEDDMDWAQYRRCFTWYDEDNPELFGSYKLGVVDIIDGDPYIMPRGVFAAGGALRGARTQVDIPDADVAGVRETLGTYYRRMAEEFEDESIIAPWDKAQDEPKQDEMPMVDDEEPEMPSELAARCDEGMKLYHAGMAMCDEGVKIVYDALTEAGLMEGGATVEDEVTNDEDITVVPEGMSNPDATENAKTGAEPVKPLTPREPDTQTLAKLAEIERELNQLME